MVFRFEQLTTGRQNRLAGHLWKGPETPKGVLIIVHGLGDHSDRYESVAQQVVAAGWGVFAFDLPGHGESPGRQGQVENFESLLVDIDHARRTIEQRFPGVRQVVLGHSMGGNLTLNYVLRRHEWADEQSVLAGAALLAPMLLPPNPPPRPIILAAWLTGYLVPRVSIRRPVDVTQLTRDEAEAAVIRDDARRHSRISLYLATQLLSQGRWALDHARGVDVPTLVMHGEADELIDTSASEHAALRIGSLATLEIWPEMKHDLLHDIDRQQVIERLIQWLKTIET